MVYSNEKAIQAAAILLSIQAGANGDDDRVGSGPDGGGSLLVFEIIVLVGLGLIFACLFRSMHCRLNDDVQNNTVEAQEEQEEQEEQSDDGSGVFPTQNSPLIIKDLGTELNDFSSFPNV